MAPVAASPFSRRLLIASVIFGLFILCDIALFGWLIFRSLSQHEVERVLLETRNEAESVASQIEHQAQGKSKDLYTAIAVEHETQTYIDSVLRQREIVQEVEIRDKNNVLVYKAKASARLPVRARPSGPSVGTGELPPRIETKSSNREFQYNVPSIQVPIGDMGTLVVGISAPELARRVEVLRGDLVRQAEVIGFVTLALLTSAYVIIWLLLKRAARLEAKSKEAERLAYIGTLASGLAHEIRNPLNSLNLNMQMLEEEIREHGGAPTGGRLLSITRSEISRLDRLVTDFLAYAKPRPLELEDLPPARLLERVTAVLAGELQRRRAVIEVEDRSGGARVRVDPGQMNQLLLNLAQNALNATEESGRPPMLRFLTYRHGGDVVLELVDNGIGMPPEEQEKIFDLFYSTRKGGTGLGLAIVERIAQTHGGRISVKSTPGVGTSVAVAFPAVSPESPARERAPIESPVGT
ncbi:MAG: two-component system, NtrC family, sensor histidine kinase HydH [Acidobacteriota bacterium]|jgi:signal transduction histidine kinase|nr:two-component system, NtrC family, sensor histidine kinase HydH [Acidobacteriota bacterium]